MSTRTFWGAEGATQLLSALLRTQPGAAVADPADFELDRHILELAPTTAEQIRPPYLPLPPNVLVLTNGATDDLVLPKDALVCGVADDLAAVLQDEKPQHVRVVVDMRDPALAVPQWSDQVQQLLRLHEQMFLAAKACSGWFGPDSSFLVTMVGGTTAEAVATPFTGLFTGFTKGLALEFTGIPVIATAHTPNMPLATALEVSATELANKQLLPIVYFAGGRRWVPRARPAKAEPNSAPLTPDSLVVAAGGARGIGAKLLVALAERHRPRIVVFGSTRLDSYDPAELAVDPSDAATGRAAYIKSQIIGPHRVSVAAANQRFDRLQEARTVHQTIAELRRHCGADRVTYAVCDLRDGAAVAAATAGLGDIDLLLNIAGTNGSSTVDTKPLTEFRKVRDLKVWTYLNLKEALAGRPPRRWCNFGSVVGFTGQRGETDYGAANDFLNTAAATAASTGLDEFTMGWTLWKDTGLGANEIVQDYLAKTGQFTATKTPEGIAHFLTELGTRQGTRSIVLLGEAETGAICDVVPEYADFRTGKTRAFPFIDTVIRHSDTELTALRTFDLERDAYLGMHVVNGFPTLPGTFVPELAAEAASALVPHRVPAVFENLTLSSFLRVYNRQNAQPKQIHAELISSDEHESAVRVRVLGHVYGPGGRILVRDRLHFEVTVRMFDSYRVAPRWQPWDNAGTRAVADPYHAPNSAVLLSEVFVSTADTRLHPRGRRARLALDPPAIRKWFGDLLVPSVLLDGLARVAVLNPIDDRWTPVVVPINIRRIEVFGSDNDTGLLGKHVELYSTPTDVDLEDPAGNNLQIAVSASGDVLLEIEGMTGSILGYVDDLTGEFRDRASLQPSLRG